MDVCTATADSSCRVLEVQELSLLVQKVRFLLRQVEMAFASEVSFLSDAALGVLDLELSGGVRPGEVARITCHQTGAHELGRTFSLSCLRCIH